MTDPVVFIGRVASALPLLRYPRQLRLREVRYYLDLCGTRSLWIAITICLLMGMVLGFHGAVQSRKFGLEIFTVDLIGFLVLKELGPLMVAMIATGRAGSAFAAEIGTMKLDEEIDALDTMGIRPEAYLVLPKLIAMIIAMPMLIVFGDIAGVVGGMIIGVTSLGIPLQAYASRTFEVLDNYTFILGVAKGVVFGILITLAGCYCGFQASRDALGVGRSATNAVVVSIFLIVVADAVIAILYSFIGY